MNELDLQTLQESYDALRAWYCAGEGRAIVKESMQEARAAGEALSRSLMVDTRLLDEAVTY